MTNTTSPTAPAPLAPTKSLGKRLLWFVLAVVAPCVLAVVVFRAVVHYWSAQAIAAAAAVAEADQPGWRQAHHVLQAAGVAPTLSAPHQELLAFVNGLPEGWPWDPAATEPGSADGVNNFVLRKGASVVDKLYYLPPLTPYEEQQIAPVRREFAALSDAYRQLKPLPADAALSFATDLKAYRTGRMHRTTRALYQVGQLYLLRTFLGIEEGQGRGVAEDLVQLTRVIGLMRGDVTLRGCQARQAILHGTLLMAERWIARNSPPEAELAAVQAVLAWPALCAPDLVGALRLERAARFEQLDADVDIPHTAQEGEDSAVARWFSTGSELQKARNRYLPMMNEAVQIAAAPRTQWPERWRPWMKELQRLIANMSPEYQTIYTWLTNVQTASLQEAMLQARCEATRLAFAAERYRLKHGKWPGSDADLIPAFLDSAPQDPYLPSPLRRQGSEELTIYSVGLDQSDQQGHLNRQLVEVDQSDLGVQLWLPATRKNPPAPTPRLARPQP